MKVIVINRIKVDIYIKDDILGMLYTAVGAVSISCYYLVAWL